MYELLEAAVAVRPEAVVVTRPRGVMTYAELHRTAVAIAHDLHARGLRRVGVLTDDPAEVLAILLASARVGVEACVYPVASTDEAASQLAVRFEHDAVLTDRDLDVATVSPAECAAATGAEVDLPPTPASRPIMVMTTGTSGYPRGVRHEWDRLLRATRRIKPAPEQRWLLAYGLNQFGGLQILIHVLAAQAMLVAAESFQPRVALGAMRAHGVTHASGTPTFWRFVVAEMDADHGSVPPLEQISLGGEAVPGALLERLRDRFPGANLTQIYGATEFGQNISVRDGLPGLPITMLDKGGDVELEVRDGELWVRSKAAMLGYHGEDSVPEGAWRATGDLVEVVGDRIEFRGRKTDVINVGGVKVHPLPVEDLISRVAGVSLARAFGRPNPMVGYVVAAEVVVEAGYDQAAVVDAIRLACNDLPRAGRPRSIKVVETMTTTGNKMFRGQA